MKKILIKIDWWIIIALVPLLFLSLSSMMSFGISPESNLFLKQSLWIAISFCVFFISLFFDSNILKKSKNTLVIYGVGVLMLVLLMFFGLTANGATSWFSFGGFTFQPADLLKLILIIVLAKYLARRHIEIRSIKHIFITAFYFIVPFILIFIQPDFGSAIILFGIWFGMIMVSGISKKHILFLGIVLISLFMVMWGFVFKDYQKDRIKNFITPQANIQSTGYQVNQSMIAVGSGGLFGKGVGYGTQSRLSFLPESETDFIFAAIAEEWGFIGSLMVLGLLFFIVIRILYMAYFMPGNFERFFAIGVACYFMSHILINIGMNIGIMPVTGVTLPFVSYGGSHLFVEFLTLGILMSMNTRNKNIISQQSQADSLLHS